MAIEGGHPGLSDAREAKREASTRFLREFPDPPQFASLTTFGLEAVSVPIVNVHAVGVGMKDVAGRPVVVPTVRFYVHRKLPRSMLSPDNVLPDSIGGVPTDVIESPPPHFAAIPGHRVALRPVRVGVSLAHPSVGAGTLGAICRREGDDGRRYALSNNHVLANFGRAAMGDGVVQPAPVDATAGSAGEVARLVDMEPLLTGGVRNAMDAALAEFLPGMAEVRTAPLGLGPVGAPVTPREGMEVVKSGRTTGVTRGVVTDVDYDLQISLGGTGLPGSILFQDAIRIEPSGGPIGNLGDSGSLFVTDDEVRSPVGLLFATGPGGVYAVACKLPAILQRFGVVIA